MKSPGRRPNEQGYVLFGIVIAIVILGIFMVAAVPLWQSVVKREREKELIFRGYQYMQAIERYQRKYPGAYPPNIKVLVKEKFLRKAYSDPMTPDGKWNVLRQLSPELQPGGQAPNAGQQAGITSLNQSQARMRTPGGSVSPVPGSAGATRQPPLAGSRFQSTLGRGPSEQSMGGVVGVASRSTETTFYQVPGKKEYKDWLFVWGLQPAAAAVPVQAGQRGRGRGQGQAQASAPAQAQNPSPFPGLPPPPTLTQFGFGSTSAVPGGQAAPGQPGLPSGFQPGGSFGQPGQPRPPGQGGFSNPPRRNPQQQPQRQPQQRQQRQPE